MHSEGHTAMYGARNRIPCAFTLVELLVVIAILGLLAGILVPTITTARANARKTACSGNLHQIGLALTHYESRFHLYPIRKLQQSLRCVLKEPELFRCPSDPEETRKDTYSLFYMGGHPALLGSEHAIIACHCHSGKPIGLFGDGRVDDLPMFKGDTPAVKVYAHLGSPDGPEITYPYVMPAGSTINLFFSLNGLPGMIHNCGAPGSGDAVLQGLYDLGGGTAGLSAQTVDGTPRFTTCPPAMGMELRYSFDINAISARFMGSDCCPLYRWYPPWGSNPPYEGYGAKKPFLTEPKEFTLLFHARPIKLASKRPEYRPVLGKAGYHARYYIYEDGRIIIEWESEDEDLDTEPL